MWPSYLVYVLAGMWPAYLVCDGWHVACLLSICVGWHVACLLSVCWLLSICVLAGMWPAYLVCVLAGPETAGPPHNQGCGPVMRSSGSPGWLLAFGLVMFLVRGVVEGLGDGRGPGVSTVMLGATVPARAGLGPVLWQTGGFPCL